MLFVIVAVLLLLAVLLLIVEVLLLALTESVLRLPLLELLGKTAVVEFILLEAEPPANHCNGFIIDPELGIAAPVRGLTGVFARESYAAWVFFIIEDMPLLKPELSLSNASVTFSVTTLLRLLLGVVDATESVDPRVPEKKVAKGADIFGKTLGVSVDRGATKGSNASTLLLLPAVECSRSRPLGTGLLNRRSSDTCHGEVCVEL
jgi:hypothetical protein